jgi:hypothetical protein
MLRAYPVFEDIYQGIRAYLSITVISYEAYAIQDRGMARYSLDMACPTGTVHGKLYSGGLTTQE